MMTFRMDRFVKEEALMEQQRKDSLELWGNEILDVWYEDLTQDLQPEIGKAQDFVGVARKNLDVLTEKVLSNDLREVVTNYEEMVEQLEGTEYQQYLD